MVDVWNIQRSADGCAEALLQESGLLRRLAGQRVRSGVEARSVGRVVQHAVRLVEVEAAAAYEHRAAARRAAETSATGTTARTEATAGPSGSARSALLVAIFLNARPHLIAAHGKDIARGRRTGDSNRLGRHRRRNARHRHAGGRDRIVAFRAAVACARFRGHHGECLKAAIARSAPARVRAGVRALCPREQRDLQIEMGMRVRRGYVHVLARDRESRHLDANNILSSRWQREGVAAIGTRPGDDLLPRRGIGRADCRSGYRSVAGLNFPFERAGRGEGCGFCSSRRGVPRV